MIYAEWVSKNTLNDAVTNLFSSATVVNGPAFAQAVEAIGFANTLIAMAYAKNNNNLSAIGRALALGCTNTVIQAINQERGSLSFSNYIARLTAPNDSNITGKFFPGGCWDYKGTSKTINSNLSFNLAVEGFVDLNDSFGASSHMVVPIESTYSVPSVRNNTLVASQSGAKSGTTFHGQLVNSNSVGTKEGSQGIKESRLCNLVTRKGIQNFTSAGASIDMLDFGSDARSIKDKVGQGIDLAADGTNESGTVGVNRKNRTNAHQLILVPSVAGAARTLATGDFGYFGNGVQKHVVYTDGLFPGVKEMVLTGAAGAAAASIKRGASFDIGTANTGLPKNSSFETGPAIANALVLPTAADALLTSVTTQPSNATAATLTGLTTSGGTGTGAIVTVTISTSAVTSVTVTTAGSGYAVGDALTIAKALIPGTGGSSKSDTDIVFTLTSANFGLVDGGVAGAGAVGQLNDIRGVGTKLKFHTDSSGDISKVEVTALSDTTVLLDGDTLTFTAVAQAWLSANLTITFGPGKNFFVPAAEWFIDSCEANIKGSLSQWNDASGEIADDSDILKLVSGLTASDAVTLGYSVSTILNVMEDVELADLYGSFSQDGLDEFINRGLELTFVSPDYKDSNGNVVSSNLLVNQLAESGVPLDAIKQSTTFKGALGQVQSAGAGGNLFDTLVANEKYSQQLSNTDRFMRLDTTNRNELRKWTSSDNYDATSQKDASALVDILKQYTTTEQVISWITELLSDSGNGMTQTNAGLPTLNQDVSYFYSGDIKLRDQVAAAVAFQGDDGAQRETQFWSIVAAYCLSVDEDGYFDNIAKHIEFSGDKAVGKWNRYTTNNFYCAGPTAMKSAMAPTSNWFATLTVGTAFAANYSRGLGQPLLSEDPHSKSFANHYSNHESRYSPINMYIAVMKRYALQRGETWEGYSPGFRQWLLKRTSVISPATSSTSFYGTAKLVANANDPANADHNASLALGTSVATNMNIKQLSDKLWETTTPAVNVEHVSNRFDNSSTTTVPISNNNFYLMTKFNNVEEILGLDSEFNAADQGLIVPSMNHGPGEHSPNTILLSALLFLASRKDNKHGPLPYSLSGLEDLDLDRVQKLLSLAPPATSTASTSNLGTDELSYLVYYQANNDNDRGKSTLVNVLKNLGNRHQVQSFLEAFVEKNFPNLFGTSAAAFDSSSPLKLYGYTEMIKPVFTEGYAPDLFYLAQSGEFGSNAVQRDNLKKSFLHVISELSEADQAKFFASLEEGNKNYQIANRLSRKNIESISMELLVFAQGSGVALTTGTKVFTKALKDQFPQQ